MNILLIHQNFPGQFKHLGPALAKLGHNVVAMTMKRVEPGVWEGITLVPYRPAKSTTQGIHPWVGDFETKVIRGEACLHAAMSLKEKGFEPDVIVAHHGWGESIFLTESFLQSIWQNVADCDLEISITWFTLRLPKGVFRQPIGRPARFQKTSVIRSM